MKQKEVNIKNALEQELNEIIGEVKTMDLPQFPIPVKQKRPLQPTLEMFIEACFSIAIKAHEYNFFYYGNMVGTFGLALEYISKQKIPSSNKVIAFSIWCNRKRMALTGWSLEDFDRIDVGEVTQDELNKLMYGLIPEEQMTFLGIHNAYRYYIEVMNDPLYSSSELKEDWIDLLDELKEHAVEIPLDA